MTDITGIISEGDRDRYNKQFQTEISKFDRSTIPTIEVTLENNIPKYDDHYEWFNAVHLCWLYMNKYIPRLPMELGPLTMMYRANNDNLKGELERWGVIQGAELTAAGRELLSVFWGDYDWALWGIARLDDQKIEDFFVELPQEMLDYGVQYGLRDVPRVPIFIAIRAREIVSVQSTYDRMTIQTYPRKSDIHKQIGEIVKNLIDPKNSLKPQDHMRTAIPFDAVLELLTNEETAGRATGDKDASNLREKIGDVLSGKYNIPPRAAAVVKKLASERIQASLELGITYNDEFIPGVTLGVVIYPSGVEVTFPSIAPTGNVSINYVPGTPSAYGEGVKSVYETARLQYTRAHKKA